MEQLVKFGYARTSKVEQNLDLQIDDLKKDGCERIITGQSPFPKGKGLLAINDKKNIAGIFCTHFQKILAAMKKILFLIFFL